MEIKVFRIFFKLAKFHPNPLLIFKRNSPNSNPPSVYKNTDVPEPADSLAVLRKCLNAVKPFTVTTVLI